MCTELFLAILYFSTIFAVNFFLFKLLKTYTKDITYLLKVQNIFKQKLPKNISEFILLYLYNKKNYINTDLLPLLNNYSLTNDIVTIGHIYSYLLKTNREQSSNKQLNNFYFELLETQYLSKTINFKNKSIK